MPDFAKQAGEVAAEDLRHAALGVTTGEHRRLLADAEDHRRGPGIFSCQPPDLTCHAATFPADREISSGRPKSLTAG
jgi:hypothetical protein